MGRIKRIRKRSKRMFKAVDKDSVFIGLMRFMKTTGWENDLRLRVADFGNTGLGVYSLTGVKEGEELIKVPLTSMITLDTLDNDAEFVEWCDPYVKDNTVSYQSLLSLFLCFHREKGSQSPWEPYLNSIPQAFSTPYFCAKEEFCHLDEHLLGKMVAQKTKVKEGYALFGDLCEMCDFEWGYFVVNTRGVYLDPGLVKNEHFKDMLPDSPNTALAPFLDFFNHSDRVTSIAMATSTSYALKVQNSYKKYEQVFINYGSHYNLQLLLLYGFIIPGNQHDFIEITVNDIANLIKWDPELRTTQIPRPKFQFINHHNLSDQMFFDVNDGPSHNLLTVLFMVFLEKNVHNLRNVAFGDALKEEDVLPYARKLLEWKMVEYRKFVDGLSKLGRRSRSGDVCLQYYQECLCYLERCKKLFEDEIIKS